VPEQYVHRIGRTARAGAAGVAIGFCAEDERAYLKGIEKLTRQKIEVVPLPENFLSNADKLKSERAKSGIPEPVERPEQPRRAGRPAKRYNAQPARPQGAGGNRRGGGGNRRAAAGR
jgi:ATP-dependent RNA helicase RhlE